MSLSLGLQYREQLPWEVAEELDQICAAVQAEFNQRLPGPIRALSGGTVSLLVGLQFREQLDPTVAAELDQMIAAIQTAFNAQRLSWVKQIVPISITLAAGVASATQTIAPAVVLANTTIDPGGWTTDGTWANIGDFLPTLTLTDTVTVTAARSGAGTAAALVVTGTLTEYYPGFWKSIQRGTVVIASGAATKAATLTTAVDPAKTALVSTGFYTEGDGTQAGVSPARLSLTNALTLTATRASTPAKSCTTAYEIREHN